MLRPIDEVDDLDFNDEALKAIERGEMFSFTIVRTHYLYRDGLLGTLEDWCESLGLKIATVKYRKKKGFPIEDWLNPPEHKVTAHNAWPHDRRMNCRCIACVGYALRFRKQLRLEHGLDPQIFEPGAPKGVHEPHRWAKIDRLKYVFEYKGRYNTVKGWAQEANIPYLSLYQRLVSRGQPIDAAMTKAPVEQFHLKHGTLEAYRNYSCRCKVCVDYFKKHGWSDVQKARFKNKKSDF